MESKDIEVCREIGQILYDAAPDDVSLVLMRAELAPEGDACKFEYDYSKENGESGWFLPENGMVDQRLRELLVLHRVFFCFAKSTAMEGVFLHIGCWEREVFTPTFLRLTGSAGVRSMARARGAGQRHQGWR